MKKLIAALILTLLISHTTSAHVAAPIKAVPSELFKPVLLPRNHSDIIAIAPTPTPKVKLIVKIIPKPVQITRHTDKTYAIVIGKATTYGYGYAGYLALPEGPGIKVKICGPVTCIIRISNDAGPDKAMQRLGRIVDLNSRDFNIVCGCDWSTVGVLDNVTVRYLK